MSEPIRILNMFVVLDRGGAETFVMNVYRNIDRTKVQFDFMVHGDKVGVYEEEICELGGRIYRMPRMGLKTLLEYNKCLKNFFQEHPEYQIVHSHMSELGCIAFRQAKIIGVPYRICHAHSAPLGVTLKTPVRYLFKKVMQRYMTEGMSCSQVAGEWQYGRRAQFTIIKNGIEVEKYRYNQSIRDNMRKQFGLDNKFVIGHVGRFERPKNHKFLVQIFSEIAKEREDARLVLVGSGTMQKEIKEEVKRLGLDEKVVFLGVREDIPRVMQMFDAFVFPSLFEGLGIVLIEAQASGAPCFASDVITRETNVTGLVEYISLQEAPMYWAKKIADTNFVREDKIQDVEKQGYDIKQSARALQEYYEKCLDI